MRIARSSCLLLIAVVTRAAAAQAPQTDSALVDAIFARYATPESPGCAVGVARDGAPILRRAYGMANLEYGVPNTPETIFEAGSVSKQFTAAAVVLLAQRGKLSLDDPVRKYVPELPDYEKTYGTPLTIRHMLNHTSGLRDWGVVASAGGWPRGSRTYSNEYALDIASRQRALNYAPGAEYLYSNTNFNLLAVIVQRVSGSSLAEFTRRELFEPLGMTHTQWRDDFTRTVKGRATAYAVRPDGPHLEMPFENAYGNGGLLTTVGDLLKWNENFVRPTVGGQALVDEMQRRGRLTSGRTISYAEGLIVDQYRGVPEVSHNGATAGYRAFLARYPQQRLSVALLCNLSNANPDALGHRVADVFLGPLPAASAASTAARDSAGVALPAGALAPYAGVYRDTRTSAPLRLTVRGDTLRTDRGGWVIPLSRTRFRSPGGGTELLFDVGPNGKPTALRVIADDDTTRFVPVAADAPTPAQLAQYEGTYTSDEAEATYTVAVENGRLTVRLRAVTSITLVPAYADAFTSSAGLVRFIRDAQGRVTAMSLELGRVRDLRFEKVK